MKFILFPVFGPTLPQTSDVEGPPRFKLDYFFCCSCYFYTFFSSKKNCFRPIPSSVRPSVAQKPLKKAEAGDFFFSTFQWQPGLPEFSWCKKWEKCNKMATQIPDYHKIYQNKNTKWPRSTRIFSSLGFPKYTKIDIFGLKTCTLATLVATLILRF
jgi:hypothetical protein